MTKCCRLSSSFTYFTIFEFPKLIAPCNNEEALKCCCVFTMPWIPESKSKGIHSDQKNAPLWSKQIAKDVHFAKHNHQVGKKTNWFCKNHKKPQNAENSETKQTRSGETPVIQTNEQLEKNVYTL